MAPVADFWKNDRGFIWLLVVAVGAIGMAQFSEGSMWTEQLIVRATFFMFTVVAVGSSVLSRRQKGIGYFVATALLVLAIVLVYTPNEWLTWIHSGVITLYMVFIIGLVVQQILAGEDMTIQKIGGGIAAYILIGHLWTSLYLMAYKLDASAFLYQGNGIESSQALRQLSYFSFVTLTTAGYGDILAFGPLAKTLSILEALMGQLFPAIFIAKLVSLHIGRDLK